MAHATQETFGYPETLIREYDHWTVQLRPQQATLGALVLICKAEVTAFSALPDAAFAEQAVAVRAIEATLARLFSYDQINYLMLMMKDPHVHYHVLPRYREPRTFEGIRFADPGWPGPPQLGHANEVDPDRFARLLARLRDAWID